MDSAESVKHSVRDKDKLVFVFLNERMCVSTDFQSNMLLKTTTNLFFDPFQAWLFKK